MKDNVRFYGILDFFPSKEKIRDEYQKMSTSDKKMYKKEVYSICFEREYVKDLIWEYLNSWEESYEKLEREYNSKKDKAYQRRMHEKNSNTDEVR